MVKFCHLGIHYSKVIIFIPDRLFKERKNSFKFLNTELEGGGWHKLLKNLTIFNE